MTSSPSLNSSEIARLQYLHDQAFYWIFVFSLLIPFAGLVPYAKLCLEPGSKPEALCTFLGFLGPIGGAVLIMCMLYLRSDCVRAIAVAKQGDAAGLRFTRRPSKINYLWLNKLPFWKDARKYDAFNMLTGSVAGEAITVMDYVATFRLGNSDLSFGQTVFILHDAVEGAPDFLLAPRSARIYSMFARVGQGAEIQLERFLELNEKFLLHSPDHTATVNWFTSKVVELCLAKENQVFQVRDGTLIATRPRMLATTRSYPDRIAAVVRLAQALREAGSGTWRISP